MATTTFDAVQVPRREDAAERAKNYVRRHWKFAEPKATAARCDGDPGPCGPSTQPPGLFDRLQNSTLCISGMAFQDAWNIDLERLQRCCVHVACGHDKLIPFCAYYVTDSSGRRRAGSSGCR